VRSLPTASPSLARLRSSSGVVARVGHALGSLACAALVTVAPGCNKNKGNAATQITEAPTMEDATGEARCSARASAAKPLVVEWPAAERAALEAKAARGLVAVRYQGCEMEVLTTCNVAGAYDYVEVTQKREGVKIRNADELYAQLPVGAAGLEAKLERSGQLNIDMLIVGRKEASKYKFSDSDLEGRCDDATHVITGLTVGAFSFYTGTAAAVGAGVKVGQVGVGAESSASQEVLKQDGDEDSCAIAGAGAPPDGCGALLRVEVVPVDDIFGKRTPPKVTAGAASIPMGAPERTPAERAESTKKARTWTLVGVAGYSIALAGMGASLGGYLLRARGATNIPTSEAGGDRASEITKYRTGTGLVYGGLGAMVGGFVLAVIATKKAKDAKRMGASVTPVLGPRMAGAGLEVSF